MYHLQYCVQTGGRFSMDPEGFDEDPDGLDVEPEGLDEDDEDLEELGMSISLSGTAKVLTGADKRRLTSCQGRHLYVHLQSPRLVARRSSFMQRHRKSGVL